MRYLIDTNIWIYYLKRTGSSVEFRLRQTRATDIAVCSVVWAELLHGARKYEKRDERVARIERTLAPYRSLPSMMRPRGNTRKSPIFWKAAGN